MPNDSDPKTAAAAYRDRIRQVLGATPAFDLVLLGLGSDGHTASLFPGQPDPIDPAAWVVPAEGGTPPVPRLTLTPSLINRSRCVCFFVTGKEKADAVGRVLKEADRQLPAAWIKPENGRLLWILDSAAAQRVQGGIDGG
jgi:6-phosphogluconolactonase